MKKVGKTTRQFRYDLNQIPYDYTLEVTNRFKGLDLRDRVPEQLWVEAHNIVQVAVIKIIPKKKKCKQAKWLSEETLQIAEKRSKRQRRKRKTYPPESRVPKKTKKRQESLPKWTCKEVKENNRMGKTTYLFKKIRDTKGTLHTKMGTIKYRNSMDLKEVKYIKRGGKNA